MNEKNTTISFDLDRNHVPQTDWTAFDAMTEEDRHAAALSDPNAQPASETQLAKARRSPQVRALRRRLNLTQEQFAQRFHLALGTIRDWEQGRNQPDHAAQVLLQVIAFAPDVVEQALAEVER